METDLTFWAFAIVAAMCVGFSKGGWPAVGMLGVPAMSLVMNPVMAAGLLLPVYIVSDAFGIWAYRRDFDRKVLWILVPPAMLGILIGWLTASTVSERAVVFVVGAIGFAFALYRLFWSHEDAPAKQPERGPGWFWGTLTGFTSFVSHAGAPPYQVYVLPLKLSKASFAGTTTILFAIVNFAKLPPYYALGQLSVQNLQIAALLFIPASVSVFLGRWLVDYISTRLFYSIVTWALLAVSLRLLWTAIFG